MFLFTLIMFAWFFVGFLGLLHCKDDGVNWWLLAFIVFVPFVPLVAKVCGLA